MMFKLALTNVKKRWQDYLVLLMGLVISVSIFYMFQTLSLNKSFLEKNIPSIAMVAIVFQLGAFLLGIITIVYMFYANSFLLSMRKKEYGMYLMLGAKKNKVSQMIAIETLFIGLVSILSGLVLGTALAKVMGSWLSESIDLPSDTYNPFVLNALIVTLIFFGILFILMMMVNVLTFKRTRTLDLLYHESQSERTQKQPLKTFVKTVFALVLIGIGYAAMIYMAQLQLVGVFVAIITITPGTFLFFSSLVPVVVERLKNNQSFSSRGLRIFTLSQLSFKASSLAKVLGLVTMMLALSLGAITVGQSFKNLEGDIMSSTPNDLVVYNKTPEISAEMDKLTAKEVLHYQTKIGEEEQYFIAEEFEEQPLLIRKGEEWDGQLVPFTKLEVNRGYNYTDDYSVTFGFSQLDESYQTGSRQDLSYKVVSMEEFNQLPIESDEIDVIRLKDFEADRHVLRKIDELEKVRYPDAEFSNGKIQIYTQVTSMTSGFMFMGFFLGIAFLGMLASCLMFKILSSAYQDTSRYEMLHKIGVSHKKLKRSLRQEIFVIFLLPGILGVIHVLVGLKMFGIFLPDPYAYLAFPFALYGCIYLGYYVITTALYRQIVLPKK